MLQINACTTTEQESLLRGHMRRKSKPRVSPLNLMPFTEIDVPIKIREETRETEEFRDIKTDGRRRRRKAATSTLSILRTLRSRDHEKKTEREREKKRKGWEER